MGTIPKMYAPLLVVLLSAVAISGCLGGGDGLVDAGPPEATTSPRTPATTEADSGTGPIPRCQHPWPCGDGSEWPAGLEGPFDLGDVLETRVPGHGGVELHGWILLPDVPDGVQVPVVLSATAYYGHIYATPESPHYSSQPIGGTVHGERLVEEGYAVAYFNVRGTGQSGGCMEWWGPNEQRDVATLVEWLGDQAWSNGRVAMTGGSYGGTTPYAAAIHNPAALKTIVPVATVTDPYTWHHTPQGAAFLGSRHYLNAFTVALGLAPPIQGEPSGTVEHATRLEARLCPETREIMQAYATEQWSETRDQAFWDERRLLDGFPELTSSVFIVHGFLDRKDSGHAQQDLVIWDALEVAPKRMFVGQWGHGSPEASTWEDELVAWFDFWLKGLGAGPPGIGTVEYGDSGGELHTSTAWPPLEARQEVLYLTGSAISPDPAEGDRAFLSIPHPARGRGLVCEAILDEGLPIGSPGTTPVGVVYMSDPVSKETLLAGNPFAYLDLGSDQPTGLFTLELFDVAPGVTCPEPPEEVADPQIVQFSSGAVDLAFHQGNFEAIPFPTGTTTPVRVDLDNVAYVLSEGHRLAVVVAYGGEKNVRHAASPHAPMLTVGAGAGEASSHVVLPVVEGTLGGDAPTLDYPPRPFTPEDGGA